MTDTLGAMGQTEDELPLVEDVWEDVLVEFGFERGRAAEITRTVFGMGALTLTERQPDEIRHIVDEELQALDFESEVGSRSQTLRTLLKEFLDAGLEGKLPGPACAPGALKYAAADSRGEAFDCIRRRFSRANVTLETIDLSQFPSGDSVAEGSSSQMANTGPKATPEPIDTSSQSAPTIGRSLPMDLEKAGRSGDHSESSTSELERVLEFLYQTMSDDSPVVRKQTITSLTSLAKVQNIRADRQIEKLIEAYQDEPAPEVRAAIIAGLEEFLHETQTSVSNATDSGDAGGSTGDESDDVDRDPRDADTSPF